MAIALRVTGSVVVGASATTISFTTPSSVVAGDTWLITATFRAGSGGTITGVPTAFTLVQRLDSGSATSADTTVMYAYTCLGTETASLVGWNTITLSAAAKSVSVITAFSNSGAAISVYPIATGVGTTSATTSSLGASLAGQAIYAIAGQQGVAAVPGAVSGSVLGALTAGASGNSSGNSAATNVGVVTAYALGAQSSQTYTSSNTSSSTYTIIAVVLAPPVGPYAYTANYGSNTVSKIDLSTFTTVGSALAVGAGPDAIAIDPSGTYAYTVNYTASTVSKINLSTFTTVGSALAVGASPYAIAITPAPKSAIFYEITRSFTPIARAAFR